MKKQLIFTLILIGIILTSCSYEQSTEEEISLNKIETLSIQSEPGHIGDPTLTPDLRIAELDPASMWQYASTPMGVRNPFDNGFYSVMLDYKAKEPRLFYPCYIVNSAPIDYSGKNDFVVCRSCDGITNEASTDYNFPGILSITTFQNGLPVGEVIKQSFWVLPTDFMVGYDWSQQYRWDVNPDGFRNDDVMFIPAGTADSYNNSAVVKEGKNLIVVEVNPDLRITESDYTNNVTTLPVRVETFTNYTLGNRISTGYLDLSAIEENKTHPPTNLIVTKNFRGATKSITIDFDCPYHMPIYVKHWFTIKKNGVIIQDNLRDSVFTDIVTGNFKSATYEIITNVTGLGASEPVSIKVTK